MLAAVPAPGEHDVGTRRAAVREEEYLHDAVADDVAAAHVVDDGAVGEDGPSPPAGRVDAVLARVDDHLLRLAERDRLAATVVHRRRDLARGAPNLARLEPALDHRDDDRAAH